LKVNKYKNFYLKFMMKNSFLRGDKSSLKARFKLYFL